jgi:hypothetical protein
MRDLCERALTAGGMHVTGAWGGRVGDGQARDAGATVHRLPTAANRAVSRPAGLCLPLLLNNSWPPAFPAPACRGGPAVGRLPCL